MHQHRTEGTPSVEVISQTISLYAARCRSRFVQCHLNTDTTRPLRITSSYDAETVVCVCGMRMAFVNGSPDKSNRPHSRHDACGRRSDSLTQCSSDLRFDTREDAKPSGKQILVNHQSFPQSAIVYCSRLKQMQMPRAIMKDLDDPAFR